MYIFICIHILPYTTTNTNITTTAIPLLLIELLRVVPGGWQLGHSGAGQGHAADRPR